jgi:hypothetical protein
VELFNLIFFVDILAFLLYSIKMYVTEKHLRNEIKNLHSLLKELSSDLGADIKYLSQEITALKERIDFLEKVITNNE